MRFDYRLFSGLAFGLIVSLLSFGIGIWTSAGHTAEDLDRFAFSLLSTLGSWLSGIGTLGAVVIALYVPVMQIRNAKVQDSVRCIHHAMAIAIDLRSRVSYQQMMLVEGGRPLAALTLNVDTMSRRYETFYDRDLYKHIPGTVINRITEMSASFLGIEALTIAIASMLKNDLHARLPCMPTECIDQAKAFESLLKDLNELLKELQLERSKLE